MKGKTAELPIVCDARFDQGIDAFAGIVDRAAANSTEIAARVMRKAIASVRSSMGERVLSNTALLGRVTRQPRKFQARQAVRPAAQARPIREIPRPGTELVFVTVPSYRLFSTQAQRFVRKLAFWVEQCKGPFGAEDGFEIKLRLLDGSGQIRAQYGFGANQWHFAADELPDGSAAAHAREFS